MRPQNLIELWVVATRPLGENGLGLTALEEAVELERIKGTFSFLPDTPAIYPAWEALVQEYEVVGKPSHDARLAAAVKVHGLKAILTSDKTCFSRFPGIEIVHPDEVEGGKLPTP